MFFREGRLLWPPFAVVNAASVATCLVCLAAMHYEWSCSQGGVKVPTGGKGGSPIARERLFPNGGRVSRSGAIPEPTVKVRMKENGKWRRMPRLSREGSGRGRGPD
ncbi:hypothetical protein GGR23_004373 [Gellertiella hungarica]|uniref:Uncharacterized protein n=1 Tax=Gellertiella hungarica TaxID=1572859 RepID=A0A7W6J987_9HYPH|nr:hypothetical protein [Gellertiella hungarica]